MDIGSATATWIGSLPNQLLVFMAIVIVAQAVVIIRLARQLKETNEQAMTDLRSLLPSIERTQASLERNTGVLSAVQSSVQSLQSALTERRR